MKIHQANYALNSLLKINLDKITANEFEFYYGNRSTFSFCRVYVIKESCSWLAIPTRDSLPLYQQTKLRADKNWLEYFFRSL